jgi:hypothetical protein
MNHRVSLLAFSALVACAASSASAFPSSVTSVPATLIENIQVTSVGSARVATVGFGQVGPIDVLRATTHMNGANGRLSFYANSKGFVVNRTGAVYDLEGGAILRLRDGLSVTGSYRMLGYDSLATGTENTEPQLSGAFVGVNLEF